MNKCENKCEIIEYRINPKVSLLGLVLLSILILFMILTAPAKTSAADDTINFGIISTESSQNCG